jgi:GNAT superfamily N-acetyltransferase
MRGGLIPALGSIACDEGSSVVFREANAEDIPALSEIRLAVAENVLSDPSRVTPEMYAAYLGASGKGWLCESDGEVVGFSIASLRGASIWALFVKPGYEGRGIGTRLLGLATDWLFEMGAPSISLSTGADTRADRVYERRGWVRGEVRPDGEVSYRLDRPGRT